MGLATLYTLVVGCLLIFFSILIAAKKPRIFLLTILTYNSLVSSIYLDPAFSKIPNGVDLPIISAHVYVNDFFAGIAILSIIFYKNPLKSVSRIEPLKFSLDLIWSMLCLGIIVCSFQAGYQTSINFWRVYFTAFALIRYLRLHKEFWEIRFVANAIVFSSLPLTFLVILLFVLNGIGQIDSGAGQHAEVQRASNSGGAFLICISFFAILFFWNNKHFFSYLIAPIQFLVLLFLQQRTVLACLIVGLIFLNTVNFRRSKTLFRLGVLLLFSTFFLFLRITFNNGLTLATNATNIYTLEFRQTLWFQRLTITRSIPEWLFGSVFGFTPATDPTIFRLTLHNFFLDFVEFCGLFGVALILVLFISSFKIQFPEYFINKFKTIFLLMLFTFSITYTPEFHMFVLWGLIISINTQTSKLPKNQRF